MVTSFGVFKYMALYSIVQFVSILILYSVLTTTHTCLLASYSAIVIGSLLLPAFSSKWHC